MAVTPPPSDGNPPAGTPNQGGQGEGGQGQGAAGAGAQGQQQAPRLGVVTQYVKDLSFENPRAPQSLQQSQGRPEIQVRVDVRAQAQSEERYEVVLKLEVEAKAQEETAFMLDLSYGGLFTLSNVPQESLHALLLIECPRILFPFARRIVADCTRDGGFPPLMIDPIDFVALYRRRLEQQQQQQGQQEGQGQASPAPGTGGQQGA